MLYPINPLSSPWSSLFFLLFSSVLPTPRVFGQGEPNTTYVMALYAVIKTYLWKYTVCSMFSVKSFFDCTNYAIVQPFEAMWQHWIALSFLYCMFGTARLRHNCQTPCSLGPCWLSPYWYWQHIARPFPTLTLSFLPSISLVFFSNIHFLSQVSPFFTSVAFVSLLSP
jgi:hypothetical protein